MQAVNAHFPEESLLRLYQLTLIGHLRLGRFVLMVEEGGSWISKAHHGLLEPIDEIQITSFVHTVKKAMRLDHNPELGVLKQFRYVIPTLRRDNTSVDTQLENTIALLLVGDIEEDLSNPASVLYKFLTAITHLMTLAIYNRRLETGERAKQVYQRELALAAQVQAGLYPEKLPTTGPVIAAADQRAHISVSGDYYDFIETSPGVHLFCIADVSGKGFPAALLMSNVQATLRTLAGYEDQLSMIVQVLNRAIYESAHGERFVTGFIGIVDSNAGTLQYVNAGHHPPVLFDHKTKHVRFLHSRCMLLGVFSPLPEVEVVTLPIGEAGLSVFMYTDGLVEAFNMDGEEFGNERMQEILLQEPPPESLSDLHAHMLAALDVFRNRVETHDDITLFTVRAKGISMKN